MIAKEFPFLDLGITLMNGEECEENALPVVSLRVCGGVVTIVNPSASNVHERHQSAFDVVGTRALLGIESAVPDHWILEWKERFAKTENRLEQSEEI